MKTKLLSKQKTKFYKLRNPDYFLEEFELGQ